jgi:hypothetical protein
MGIELEIVNRRKEALAIKEYTGAPATSTKKQGENMSERQCEMRFTQTIAVGCSKHMRKKCTEMSNR